MLTILQAVNSLPPSLPHSAPMPDYLAGAICILGLTNNRLDASSQSESLFF